MALSPAQIVSTLAPIVGRVGAAGVAGNLMQETRVCKKCGLEKLLDREHFYYRRDREAWFSCCKICSDKQKKLWHERNRERTNAYHREWRKKNASKRRRHAVKSMYGLAPEDHDAMLVAQGDACAICRSPFGGKRSDCAPCVDHDHKTGAIRGLLCHRCNHGLGHFKDNPASLRAAAAYIEGSLCR